ncbi:MAG: hypothetical protein K6E40_11455 [Desulfovibrio sp.]|nr:hypothetical protein [Desulfovibrio sp.]
MAGSKTSKLLVLLAGASIAVACGGVVVGHKAVSRAETFMQRAVYWKGQAEDSKARLAVAKGQLADAERRIEASRNGLTKEQRRILSTHVAGRPGTLAYKNANPCNVKNLGRQRWRGEIGRDRHGHCIFSDIQYGLRAAVLTLRSYQTRHGIKTLDGIIDRFCGGNPDYVAFLSRKLGLRHDEEFKIIPRIPELVRWMSVYESGREVAPSMIAMLDILASI